MTIAIRAWAKRRREERERTRRHGHLFVAAAALIGLALGQGGAMATSGTPSAAVLGPAMALGRMTSQPVGHYEFCMRRPDECAVRAPRGVAPVAMTASRWIDMVEINDEVNGSITPLTDFELHGLTELWSYPGASGDCEDYVLQKRRMLMERGFAAADLLITVVRRPNGEGHAVLTVRTDRGDFVLDNLEREVLDWRSTPYRFLKRQASHHSGRWVDITNGASPLYVGAVE